MISAAVLTACIVSMAGLVGATPAPRQTTQCHPNFESTAVSVIDGDAEWGVSPVAAGTRLVYSLGQFPLNGTAEWHVQQTGDFPPTYIVKEINHNDLVVDAASGELTLEKSDSSKVSQLWQISCNSCSSGASSTPGPVKVASGCKVVSGPPSGLCAELEHGGVLGHIQVEECAQVIAQTWDFWTAPA